MSQAELQQMSREDFFEWVQAQELRHELVDGRPVMMAGSQRRHNEIAINALVLFKSQLRGLRCLPYGGDFAIATPAGNIRYPDMSVDCGATADDSMIASEPAFALEVLSKSTARSDQNAKLADYKTVPTLTHVLIVDPNRPQARLYTRTAADAWDSVKLTNLAARIELPSLGVGFSLADLYSDLAFPPSPALLLDEAPA
jgi:Uma2 family endonuclease